jgi:hypothetical protein
MHTATEDVLRIADGAALEGDGRERSLEDPRFGAEPERLARRREALRDLPVLAPPPGLWPRILEAAAHREARVRRFRRRTVRAALAAAIVAVAGFGLYRLSATPQTPPGAVAAAAREAPGRSTAAVRRSAYAPLVAESVALEHSLKALDGRPRLMSAGTASTIAGLEDRIALVDDQLSLAEAATAEPEHMRALWGERVDLMNALVQVRYAQAGRYPSYREEMR